MNRYDNVNYVITKGMYEGRSLNFNELNDVHRDALIASYFGEIERLITSHEARPYWEISAVAYDIARLTFRSAIHYGIHAVATAIQSVSSIRIRWTKIKKAWVFKSLRDGIGSITKGQVKNLLNIYSAKYAHDLHVDGLDDATLVLFKVVAKSAFLHFIAATVGIDEDGTDDTYVFITEEKRRILNLHDKISLVSLIRDTVGSPWLASFLDSIEGISKGNSANQSWYDVMIETISPVVSKLLAGYRDPIAIRELHKIIFYYTKYRAFVNSRNSVLLREFVDSVDISSNIYSVGYTLISDKNERTLFGMPEGIRHESVVQDFLLSRIKIDFESAALKFLESQPFCGLISDQDVFLTIDATDSDVQISPEIINSWGSILTDILRETNTFFASASIASIIHGWVVDDTLKYRRIIKERAFGTQNPFFYSSFTTVESSILKALISKREINSQSFLLPMVPGHDDIVQSVQMDNVERAVTEDKASKYSQNIVYELDDKLISISDYNFNPNVKILLASPKNIGAEMNSVDIPRCDYDFFGIGYYKAGLLPKVNSDPVKTKQLLFDRQKIIVLKILSTFNCNVELTLLGHDIVRKITLDDDVFSVHDMFGNTLRTSNVNFGSKTESSLAPNSIYTIETINGRKHEYKQSKIITTDNLSEKEISGLFPSLVDPSSFKIFMEKLLGDGDIGSELNDDDFVHVRSSSNNTIAFEAKLIQDVSYVVVPSSSKVLTGGAAPAIDTISRSKSKSTVTKSNQNSLLQATNYFYCFSFSFETDGSKEASFRISTKDTKSVIKRTTSSSLIRTLSPLQVLLKAIPSQANTITVTTRRSYVPKKPVTSEIFRQDFRMSNRIDGVRLRLFDTIVEIRHVNPEFSLLNLMNNKDYNPVSKIFMSLYNARNPSSICNTIYDLSLLCLVQKTVRSLSRSSNNNRPQIAYVYDPVVSKFSHFEANDIFVVGYKDSLYMYNNSLYDELSEIDPNWTPLLRANVRALSEMVAEDILNVAGRMKVYNIRSALIHEDGTSASLSDKIVQMLMQMNKDMLYGTIESILRREYVTSVTVIYKFLLELSLIAISNLSSGSFKMSDLFHLTNILFDEIFVNDIDMENSESKLVCLVRYIAERLSA